MPFYNPQFVMGFSCCSGFYFCVVFCESLFVFFSRLAIVLPYLLSVGHCTALPHLGWPLYCLNLLNLPLLRSLFVLFSRLDIVLPYLPQLTTSDIIICFILSVGHCTALPSLGWPLYWPTFLNLPLLIMPLVSSNFSFRQIFY
jgi:hypothetical protein